MRDTMRDGQKATRTASNRSKVPKEPLGRVDTTTSRPEITRAPSSMDATRAAGAAINRHGTPMHPAITKPRESPAKRQPVRRPRRGTNTPPSPIFEDIDLELDLQSGTMSSRSTNPSSFGSSARKKESFDSWSTGPDQHSLRASDDGSRFRTETPGTEGQGSPPPRATKERGCFMNALQNFWEDWKEVRRLGGPSMEAMLWEDIKDWWSGGNKKMTDVERPAAAQPAYELDQFASEANRGFLEQAQRAVTPRVPPAAARRGGPGRPHDSDVDTEVTTWSKVINQSRGIGSKSGLRNEVRNDSPHKGDDPSRGPAFRIRTQHQGLYEHRDDTIDHNSFDDFNGDHGDDWDRQTRAPTMASSNHGARMSHANPSDWQPVNAQRPTSSIYTTTTNGHPNSQHYGRSETPPSVPAIPDAHLLAPPKAAGGGSQGYTKSLAETHTTEMTSVTKLLGKPDKDGKWDKIIK
ncbi:hypothetical protein E6O75_ATG00548 [Venturia nashicola]|uniref:Uncharacterized protein n=1 Tax=Venturia nashicola TaxID=86259 RepID=A0A4Z1PE46_9PEZI|nr:hypothetical protein E6O75_ATG00548 [Venturia nashicola]